MSGRSDRRDDAIGSDAAEGGTLIKPEDITGSFVPVVDSTVVAFVLDGESVLYRESANTVHVLNATATVIWQCLDGHAHLDELCADLAAVFSVPVERLSTDVLEAVRQFGKQGLLAEVEPEPEVVKNNRLESLDVGEAPGD